MYVDGQNSGNLKHGMIVCVPMNPWPMRPENFRHMTLLNVDFKLLSRILAIPKRHWLTTLLHPSQRCGIHDHNIFETIAGLHEATAYTKCTRSSMFVLSLDIKQAFNNISKNYLFHILDNHGFSTLFQRCIRNKYRNATSSIHTNGHTTSRIPIKSLSDKDVP